MLEPLEEDEELAQQASFLWPAARRELVMVWTRHLLGENAAAGYRGSPLAAALPRPWREAVERTFELLEPWRALVAGRREAARRVVTELVERLHQAEWMLRKSQENPRNSALAARMREAATLPPERFAAATPELLDQLVQHGPGGGLRFAPLRELWAARLATRDQAGTRDKAREAFDDAAFRETLLGRWSAAHAEDVEDWEARALLAALGRLQGELERKRSALSRITRALGVGLEYLGRGADWSSGFWREDLWHVLEDFAARVESSPALQRLAEMLGRYEEDRRRFEEQLVEEDVPERRVRSLVGGRSEVRGLHLSDDLNRLTAADLALLADPDTELLFFTKYLEKRLLTYEMDARELYEATRRERRLRLVPRPDRQRGPIVLCLDTSASMSGDPELVAKTICLALLRVALRERRRCWAISFSSANDLRELELSRFPDSLAELLSFLAGGFHGGTDPGPALGAAMKRIEAADYARADLLVVTDGMFALEEDTVARFQAARARMDFRLHALIIGDHSRADTLPHADFQWTWRRGETFLEGGVQLVRGVERR
jgi:uncharacterized protein with von Willebrand factor type A (vWA) domain